MRSESKHEFIDISSEQFREYSFVGPQGLVTLRIENPTHLSVSESGGHRVFDAAGVSHYIPKGWVHLGWMAKSGEPNFVA